MTARVDNEASQPKSHILIVDDNLIDARATRRALQNLAAPTEVHHLTDGGEALAYLINEPGTHETPDLVLLDLNLPGLQGLEILRWMMTDPSLPRIPVMVLSTSDHESDIQAAHRLGARGYFQKPLEINGWGEIIGTIDQLIAADARGISG